MLIIINNKIVKIPLLKALKLIIIFNMMKIQKMKLLKTFPKSKIIFNNVTEN